MRRARPERRVLATRERRRGYTMIEVLMGLAILAVGASGVIALQKVTVLGVTHGRNVNTATAIAAAHLEALRVDAQRWNSMSDYAVDPTLLNTVLVPSHGGTTAGPWVLPSSPFPNDDAVGPGLGVSDVTGATDGVDADGPPVAFCTHVRATPIVFDPARTSGSSPRAEEALMLRLEARTFWAKSGREVRDECQPGFETTMTEGLAGGPIAVGEVTYSADDYGWVFLATAVRRNFMPE